MGARAGMLLIEAVHDKSSLIIEPELSITPTILEGAVGVAGV